MKYVDITTAQNVTIRYSVASVAERALAAVIDAMIAGTIGYFLYYMFEEIGGTAGMILSSIIFVPFILFYSFALERFNNGQSIGKRALRLRVIRVDGEAVELTDYLMRWIFRGIDVYFSLGTIAAISVIASNKSQRVGDLLGNTIVVKIGKSDRLSIENLLKLNTNRDPKITYPQVLKLPEETFILIREALTKHRKFKNDAHQKAIFLLVDRVCQLLELEKPKNDVKFLQTLLNDYVVLTR